MAARSFASTLSTRCAAGLLGLFLLLAPGTAPAGEVPVFLGAIGVGRARPEVESELRSLLRAELAATDFTRVKTNERYMLSATLVRLDSVQSSDTVRATCVISVAVLRDGSTLHALVQGRATAEEARPTAARRDALRAAVHSAMIRVPKALR